MRSGPAAERSYPTSKVRGRGREEISREQGQGRLPGGDAHAPSPRPGAAGRRRYPTPLSPRPRAATGRSNRTTEARGGGWEDQPHVQGAVAARAQEGPEDYPTLKVRKGGSEETPLIQGKEQWLQLAGAAVKRYPMPKVRETQVRR